MRGLVAEGWITTENGRGTFVAKTLPDPRPRRFTAAPETGADSSVAFELGPGIAVARCATLLPVAYNLTGLPDLRLVPTKALARAWRRSIERRSREVLAPARPKGIPVFAPRWRAGSATRGLVIDESRLLITRGTQGAFAVIAHGLLRRATSSRSRIQATGADAR